MNTETVLPDVDLDALFLDKGNHKDVAAGVCAMELVAYIAGEPHSDHPECACPVLTAFVISLNDNWSDEDRQRLKPFLPRLVGTADPTKREFRSWMALDWYIREHMPAWLELAGLAEDAAKVRSMPPILSVEAAIQAMPILNHAKVKAAAAGAAAGAAARDAARDAARAAAWAATGAAAWAATGAAAWTAAGAAARVAARDAAWAAAWAATGAAAWTAAGAAAWTAAGAAARVAAGDAAWAAARDAAWAAARAKLQPTVDHLQSSALELLNRMIDA